MFAQKKENNMPSWSHLRYNNMNRVEMPGVWSDKCKNVLYSNGLPTALSFTLFVLFKPEISQMTEQERKSFFFIALMKLELQKLIFFSFLSDKRGVLCSVILLFFPHGKTFEKNIGFKKLKYELRSMWQKEPVESNKQFCCFPLFDILT